MTDPRRVRWGVLSTARILRRLVPPLRESPRSELVAIASRDGARAREAAERWGAARAHDSYEALLADPDIDAVYLPLPNHLHAPWLLRCIDAGKHVLCEKPLALSGADVEEVAAAAARRGVHVAEAFVHLHHPQLAAMRGVLGSGELGAPVLLRGGYSFRITDPGNIRLDPARGGGSLWDVGCYPVSLFIALLGAAPAEVSAMQVLSASGVDETFAGQLRFEGPGGRTVLAQVDCGFTTALRETVEIACTEGTLAPRSPFRADIDGTPGGLIVRKGAETRIVEVPPCVPFGREVAAFEALLLDGAAPVVPLSLSADVARTLAALYESARTGRPVPLQGR
jgi:D-xylose 1-dehydrogenase (NADP+, D-xylono-1,5-lactone-forming)